MGLFELGDFTLNSGKKSKWKLECDYLKSNDWLTLAEMVSQMVGPFSYVEGIPRGGILLSEALTLHQTCVCGHKRKVHGPGHKECNGFEIGPYKTLLVDDVLTTGGSMERRRKELGYDLALQYGSLNPYHNLAGAVIFARGECPNWIKAVFQMPEELWIETWREEASE